ncbi:hypothetical protein QZJ86_12885 [Methylomonas montana]|uniref:hypothetical protein n=1 Tax=Methylomonas montana TaxID=3058963 RepID=UPI0026584E88|nr:hypothetical protein [Methylomonas montana]WKJ88916.1 hypothetical protein QZJ86_12885 [Methylomonas montana]
MKVTGILTSLQINEDRPGDSLNVRVDDPNGPSRFISIYGLKPDEVRSLSSHLGYTVSISISPDIK